MKSLTHHSTSRFFAFPVLVLLFGFIVTEPFIKPNPEELVGTWIIDLRPTPDAEAYFQELAITSVDGGEISGTFYGSPIRDGHLNVDWGAVRFAFVTEDGSGEYHTSGTLRGDRIEGLTHSIGRGFLAYWRATRAGSIE